MARHLYSVSTTRTPFTTCTKRVVAQIANVAALTHHYFVTACGAFAAIKAYSRLCTGITMGTTSHICGSASSALPVTHVNLVVVRKILYSIGLYKSFAINEARRVLNSPNLPKVSKIPGAPP